MVSLKTFTSNKYGFSLIEVLVVLGIISILLATTLFFNINTYRGDAFRAEGKMLQSLLQTARANAINNINQQPHGVVLHPDGYNGYVLFEGIRYEASNPNTLIQIPTTYPVSLGATSPSEIVFTQLSGNANFQGTITLIDQIRHTSTSIGINYEGNISY